MKSHFELNYKKTACGRKITYHASNRGRPTLRLYSDWQYVDCLHCLAKQSFQQEGGDPMRQTTLTLDGEQPISWNQMYSGQHWSTRHAEAQRVHLAVRVAIDPDWPMFDRTVHIMMTVYFKNKRVQLDASNVPAKLYEDGLIGWLIEDDSPQYVRSMTTVSLIDRQNPRVEIEIREVENG